MLNFTDKFSQTLERAAQLAKNHEFVECEHVGFALINDEIFNFLVGAKHLEILNYLEDCLNKMPVVGEGKKDLSSKCSQMIQNAVKKSADYNDSFVSIEWLVYSFLQTLPSKINIDIKEIENKILQLREGSKSNSSDFEMKYRALEEYTVNLTALALEDKLDPVIGRDCEIKRALQILSRKNKNNPILVGDPGVGKTAIVYGLAMRIVANDVPENLKNFLILELDLTRLLAGTKYRGEFEERLNIIMRIIRNKSNIILFIDEIHMLVGAGKTDGAMDAANILKPALARGELRCIGATTKSEYRKYIEKDEALSRRFQPIDVEEPSVEDTITILRGLKSRYELYHGLRITDEAIQCAAKLSARYISERKLPDKGVDLIDEACAKVKMIINSEPEILDSKRRMLISLKMEHNALLTDPSNQNQQRLKELEKIIFDTESEILVLQKQWQQDKEELAQLRALKRSLDLAKSEQEKLQREGKLQEAAKLFYSEIPRLEQDIQNKQNNMKSSLIRQIVTQKDVAQVLENWTGISSQKLLEANDFSRLQNIESIIGSKIIGQKEAIKSISNVILRSKMGMNIVTKPIGSFLFVGPTGVGKTELAKELADYLFNDENALIIVNCSEFNTDHSVSKLIGSPPGYIGYDEGGGLTNAVRSKRYCIILFDEFEKAHPRISNLLLQVLDAGILTDGKGKTVDFKQTIIIMTSNIGAKHFIEFSGIILNDATKKLVQEDIKKTFSPEFLNRLDDILLFNKLSSETMLSIVDLRFKDVQKRAKEQNIEIILSENAKNWLAINGYNKEYGARPLVRLIENRVTDLITQSLLYKKIQSGDSIIIALENNQFILQKNN